jgi:hypothetical protein
MTGSDDLPSCVAPFEGAADAANCNQVVGEPLDVGLYSGTAGPYGTLDQAGNLYEWAETVFASGARYLLGGSYASGLNTLFDGSASSASWGSSRPDLGFRLIQVPEPGIGEMALAGMAMLSVLGRLRSRHARR